MSAHASAYAQPDPTRWRAAVERALAEGIKVVQVGSTGQWVATSGSQPGVAYALAVTGNVAHGCECPAAEHGHDACKHRAAYYLLIGALAPEVDVVVEAPPAPPVALPAAPPRDCRWCCGGGVLYSREYERRGLFYPQCEDCHGTGLAP